MKTARDFSEIPCIGEVVVKKYKRTLTPGNPHELLHIASQQAPFDQIFTSKVVVQTKDEHGKEKEERITKVFVKDFKEANRILLNKDGIWVKGITTWQPFLSIVPKHLIALEGEEHVAMRRKAIQALTASLEGRLPPIVADKVQVSCNSILMKAYNKFDLETR